MAVKHFVSNGHFDGLDGTKSQVNGWVIFLKINALAHFGELSVVRCFLVSCCGCPLFSAEVVLNMVSTGKVLREGPTTSRRD